jgi:hypothetical protein
MSLNLTMLRSARLSKHICGLCVFSCLVFLTPLSVQPQTPSLRLTATINETVALSIAPDSSHSEVDVDIVNSASSARMTLSGTGIESQVVRIRLLVRSNIGFNISGMLESKAILLAQLSVRDVRPTGRLVSPEVIDNVEIPREFDMRGRKDKDVSENGSSILDVSQPFLLLSGPRVSLGGTLKSPKNALQISLLIRIKPEPTRDWQVQLTFFTVKQPVQKVPGDRRR